MRQPASDWRQAIGCLHGLLVVSLICELLVYGPFLLIQHPHLLAEQSVPGWGDHQLSASALSCAQASVHDLSARLLTGQYELAGKVGGSWVWLAGALLQSQHCCSAAFCLQLMSMLLCTWAMGLARYRHVVADPPADRLHCRNCGSHCTAAPARRSWVAPCLHCPSLRRLTCASSELSGAAGFGHTSADLCALVLRKRFTVLAR